MPQCRTNKTALMTNPRADRKNDRETQQETGPKRGLSRVIRNVLAPAPMASNAAAISS
jgi:hypothetical protein